LPAASQYPQMLACTQRCSLLNPLLCLGMATGIRMAVCNGSRWCTSLLALDSCCADVWPFATQPLVYMVLHMTLVTLTFLLARLFWESFAAVRMPSCEHIDPVRTNTVTQTVACPPSCGERQCIARANALAVSMEAAFGWTLWLIQYTCCRAAHHLPALHPVAVSIQRRKLLL